MNKLLAYLSGFLPILIGLVFFFILKSLTLYKNRIKISTDVHLGAIIALEDLNFEYEPKQAVKDFGVVARDLLIINGIYPRSSGQLDQKALKELGYADLSRLDRIKGAVESQELTIFTSDKHYFISKMLNSGRASGIMLAYAASDKLKIIS